MAIIGFLPKRLSVYSPLEIFRISTVPKLFVALTGVPKLKTMINRTDLIILSSLKLCIIIILV